MLDKKILFPLIFALAFTLILGFQAEAQEVNLNILAMSMESTEYMEAVQDRFIEKWADEGVEVSFSWDYMEEEDLRPHAVEDAAAGVGHYQIYQVGTQHIPLMAVNNWIVPIEDYFTEDYAGDEFTGAVVEGASFEGTMYGVPLYNEATHLIYRHDVFEELGLNPPETLEEMKEKAAYIDEQRDDIAGVVLRGQRGAGLNHVSWKQYLNAFGGEWLTDLEPPYEAAFYSEEGIEATEWYTEMIREYAPEGTQTAHWRDVMADFMAGRAAMTVDATSIGRRIVTEEASEVIGKTSFALIPEGPAGRFPWFFSWNLVVSEPGTQDELTREVATDFVLWATSQEMKLEIMHEEAVLPARSTTLEMEEVREFYDDPGMSNWLENTLESMEIEEARENPVIVQIPDWPSIGDTIGIYLEEIFTGALSVEDGLREAAETIDRDF